jgi:predicted DNA-binding transcriptional regulator YafY
MRADRLLSILMQLQVEGRLTASELADRLEVSERTILRDMDALAAAGVPVIADRGRHGGWRLTEAYRTDVTGLSQAEVTAMALPFSQTLLRDMGLSANAHGAWAKVIASLPESRRRQAELVRERLYVDTASWRQTGDGLPLFQALQEAVWQQRWLAMAYEKADGSVIERLVAPLGLVAKGSTWYLIAMHGTDEATIRSYRASRIQQAALAADTFDRPAGFDLATYWGASKADFVANLPAYRLTGRVSPILLPRLAWVGRSSRIEETGPPEADGWSRVVVRVQTFEEAVEYALGLGTRFRVTGPDDLVDAVTAAAREVAAFYGPVSEG